MSKIYNPYNGVISLHENRGEIDMVTFYDLISRCWFLNVEGKLGYVPDHKLVWDKSLAGNFVVLHKDYLPGRESDINLRNKLNGLKPVPMA